MNRNHVNVVIGGSGPVEQAANLSFPTRLGISIGSKRELWDEIPASAGMTQGVGGLFQQFRSLHFLLVFIVMLFAWPCFAGVITVPGDYPTIQQAIDASVNGDEIIVSPSTYVENISFGGKNIVLRSTGPTDPAVVAGTVIDGNAAGSVVTFSGTEDETCILAGFTITSGYASRYGGGIDGGNNTHATIQYNTISGNSAKYGGGLYGCDGTIQNNTISGNSTERKGGGLAWCNGTIQNNIISANSAGSDGGGLYYCSGPIRNNTIWDNSASSRGGGLYGCHGAIQNCIIWENDAPTGAQLYGSSTPSYSCIQDWAGGGVGNIALDPLLVDPANGDFHLWPGSPCIDAGYTYYLFFGQYLADIDGECRLAGGSVDMGADEYGSSPDSDGDLLPDDDEIVRGSSISYRDTDDDGLIDGAEVLRGTDPTVYDSPTGLSIPSDFPDIQQGLFLAFPSETITVSPSTYHENLRFTEKNVVLQNIDPLDPDIVAITIIDGNGVGPVVTFSGTEDETCVLAGFTVTNGYNYRGGGISGNDTHATIQNNTISGNSADYGGGLAYCDGTIQNNTISGNSADDDGGGLYGCDGTIQNNIISGNSADASGGGLNWCDGAIQYNTISGNSAGYGGGLALCHGPIQYNTISGNSAYSGGGLAYCDRTIQDNIISDNIISENSARSSGGGLYGCDSTIKNNTISGNSADYGGGLAYCDRTIQNNIISGNLANWYGGALYDCDGPIRKNTMSGNSASRAGGGLHGCLGPIKNNTISGNSASSGGGLAYCHGIRNNTISGNSADDYGGGLAYCDRTIQDNIISGNSADYGGGLYDCDGLIRNNTISGNSADDSGGGLFSCAGLIASNAISGNSADYGGGLDACNGTIQNNTIWGNSAGDQGGGLAYCDGTIQNNTIYGNSAVWLGGGLYNCHGAIQNCIISGNDATDGVQLYECSLPSYSCIQDWAGGGVGNIALDPLLVDPANGDFHLEPGSPCIDAGYTYYLFFGQYLADIDGECRLAGSSVDMGADEYGSSPDSDGDLLADDDEIVRGSSISDTDTDDDGLIDGAEVLRGTDPTVYDSPTGLSIPSDFPDIQQGLFLAFPSETITVSPGTYYVNLHFLGRNVVLQNIDPLDPDIVAITVIDGNGAGPVVTFSGTEDETCVLAGFTITNGYAVYAGGGISGNDTHATIQNNIISANSAQRGGGLRSCHGPIQNNTISGNYAYSDGGGLYLCGGPIKNNTILGNSADDSGGGLAYCDGPIQNNTISGNSASSGGGLHGCGAIQNNTISGNSAEYGGGGLYDCDGPIQNNTISGNSASSGGGLAYCDAIRNNTISGNSADDSGGGLAYCDAIRNNTISGNSADLEGGGLAYCDHTIQDNIISGNSADYGGGLAYCDGLIRNNTISGNSADDDGGGLAYCDGTIRNNTISGSSAASYGGGLFWCNGAIENNTIWGNSAGEYGGGLDLSRGTIKNCIIWENNAPTGAQLHGGSTPSYSCIQDWAAGGVRNIADDPLLVDPANGDFHLEPGSPCIDTGGNVPWLTEDFEGDPRPCDDPDASGGDGSKFDIGADEYIPPVDVNRNGRVDAVDIQLVINAALDLPVEYDCDVDGDGYVTAVDIQLVINAVLRSK